MKKIRENQQETELSEIIPEITQQEKVRIERDVREMAGIVDEEMPVILDLESNFPFFQQPKGA